MRRSKHQRDQCPSRDSLPFVSPPSKHCSVGHGPALTSSIVQETLSLPTQGYRRVLVVQNPNYFGRANLHPMMRAPTERLKTQLAHMSIRRAERVIAISNSLADDIIADIPSVAGRLTVLHSGTATWPETSERPQALKNNRPYLLCLGNDYPHKNLPVIVRAWSQAKAQHGLDLGLTIAGAVSDARRSAFEALDAQRVGPALTFLGPVTNRSEVRWLLENATALVTASSAEAFPLTPAEAGSMGCPVILSDIPPHREVAGHNTMYFSLDSHTNLVDALRGAYNMPRARWEWHMTWHQHAQRLAEILAAAA